MEVRRFKSARELVNSMNAVSKRVWISANDPISMILKVVDEHLEYVFEIAVSHFKTTEVSLSGEEQKAFMGDGNRCELVKGVEISEHQKFLLSNEYWQSMALYLTDKYNSVLKKSSLRVNGEVGDLSGGAFPYYDIDPENNAYYFDEDRGIVGIVGNINRTRMNVPIFEVASHFEKEYKSIWDVKIDDFINEDGIFHKENELYKKIVEKFGVNVKIVIPIKTPLTVLTASDWVNKKFGFSVFEYIGIGIYKND